MKSQLDYTTFVARREKARISLQVCSNTEMAKRSITIHKSIAASCMVYLDRFLVFVNIYVPPQYDQ
jgi:hypothetical protein